MRFLVATVAVVLGMMSFVAPAPASQPAGAPQHGVEVTVALPEVIYSGAVFAAEFVVANPNPVPVSEFSFEPSDACGPSVGLTERTEDAGNGDNVLDPAEVWRYRAPRCLTWAINAVGATVSYAVPSGEVVEQYELVSYEIEAPLVPDQVGDLVSQEHQPIDLPVTIRNVSPVRVEPTDGTAELWSFDAAGAGTLHDTTALQETTGNGDAVVDPGEVWAGSFATPTGAAGQEPLELFVAVDGWNPDEDIPAGSGDHYGFWYQRIGTLTFEAAASQAGIAVAAEFPDPIFMGAIFAVDFVVTNDGGGALSSVVVEPTDACGPSSGSAVWTEDSGNGDDVFDPSEVWRYTAPRCLTWAVPFATIIVDYVAPNGSAQTVVENFEYDVIPPLLAEPIGDLLIGSGTRTELHIEVENVSPIRVEPRANVDTAELWIQAGDDIPVLRDAAPLTEVAGNGDGIVDPGETWAADLTTPLMRSDDAPLTLFIRMDGWNPDEDIPAGSGDDYGTNLQRIGTLAASEAPWVHVREGTPESVFHGEVFSADYVVENAWHDPIRSVALLPLDACAATDPDAVEWSEESGNGDDLFDPGEEWRYHVPRCVASDGPYAGYTLLIEDILGVMHIDDFPAFELELKAPLPAEPVGSLNATAGEFFDVGVVVENVSPVRIEMQQPAELWRGVDTPHASRIGEANLEEVSGNGDSIIDPGEVWAADFRAWPGLSEHPSVPLTIIVEGWNPDEDVPVGSGDGFSPHQLIGSLQVVPAQAPAEELPATGPSNLGGVALAGVLALGLGLGLLRTAGNRGRAE